MDLIGHSVSIFITEQSTIQHLFSFTIIVLPGFPMLTDKKKLLKQEQKAENDRQEQKAQDDDESTFEMGLRPYVVRDNSDSSSSSNNENEHHRNSSIFNMEIGLSPPRFLATPNMYDAQQNHGVNENTGQACNLPIAAPVAGGPEAIDTREDIIEGIVVAPRQKFKRTTVMIVLGVMCLTTALAVAIFMMRKEDKAEVVDDDNVMTLNPSLSPSISMEPTSTTEGILLELFLPLSEEEVLKDPTSTQHFTWKVLSYKVDIGHLQLNDTKSLTNRYVMSTVTLGVVDNLDRIKPTLVSTKFPPICKLYKCSEEGLVQVVQSRNQWSAGLAGGFIQTEVGHMVALTHLIFTRGKFYGTIPTEIGNLQELQYLDLNENLISGTIPTELGRLKNLRALNLRSNQLSGSIPSELGNLANLSFFDVSSNHLTGTIPKEIRELKNLEAFSTINNTLQDNVEFLCDNIFSLSEEAYYEIIDIKSQSPYELSGEVGLLVDCHEMNNCSCCRCS